MTEPFELFRRAVDGFGRLVHLVEPGQWHDPTPDDDWDVRMLVNHLAVEQLWVPPLVDGKTIADVGDSLDGDRLGDDPVAAWDDAVADSLESFSATAVPGRTVQLSYGERPTLDYMWEMTTDALIHSWDLARAIQADETLDPELSQFVYDKTLPMAEELVKTGLFKAVVPVADNAPLQTRLLAIFGRRA